MIMEYNATKDAVDFLDKMASSYSCKRITRDGLYISIIHNITDISCFNAHVLYSDTYPGCKQKRTVLRRLFLEKLTMEQVNDHIQRRKAFSWTNASLKLVQVQLLTQRVLPP